MRVTIDIDPEVLEEGMALTGAASAQDLLRRALAALVEEERAVALGRAREKIVGASSWKSAIAEMKKKPAKVSPSPKTSPKPKPKA